MFSACTKADGTSEEAEKQEVPETSLTGRELMYIKNNGLYEHIPGKDEATRISKDKYKKRFAFELRESSLPEVQYSLDGKYVYYIEAMDEDYLRALKVVERKNYSKDKDEAEVKDESEVKGESEVKDESEAEDEENDTESKTIAKAVSEFRVLKNGKVLYVTELGLGIYIWDGENSKNIAEYTDFYSLSEDEGSMIYLAKKHYSFRGAFDFKNGLSEYDRGERCTLYLYNFKEEPYEIDNDVVSVSITCSKDLSSIYYVKEENDTYNIYYINDITKPDSENKKPVFIAELGRGLILMNKKTEGLYYLSENKESSLYDLIIEDDIPDMTEGVSVPEISEEDKALMFKEKAVIKDKGLKEYALQQMKMELKEKLKKITAKEYFGTLSYYDKNSSKTLSTDVLVASRASISSDEPVSFTYFDKDKIEKIKLSSLFEDYIYKLDEYIKYSDDEISNNTDQSGEKKLNLDKLIYEYYKDKGSPLGEYFYVDNGDSDKFKSKLEADFYLKYWDYDLTSEVIVEDFMRDILWKQNQAFAVAAVLEDKVYRLEEGGHNISDIYIDEEDNNIYIVKNDKETEDKIKSLSEGSYKYFSSEIDKAVADIYRSRDCELYKADLKDGKLESFELLDSGVSRIYGIYNKKLYYVKGNDNIFFSIGTLYCDKREIKSECVAWRIINGTVYLETDPKSNYTYDLYKLNGDDTEKIGSEVYEFKIFDDGSVAYIDNYNRDTGMGTLESWTDNGNKETLDKDVINIVGGMRSSLYLTSEDEENVYIKFR